MVLIYYGDELGLEGGNDPDCRRIMPWNNIKKTFLKSFIKLTSIRKNEFAMKNGILTGESYKNYEILEKYCENDIIKLIIPKRYTKIKIDGKILFGINYKINKKFAYIKESGFVLEKSKVQ